MRRAWKFLFEALSIQFGCHQAAWVFDPLAWCFSAKPGLRPVYLFEVFAAQTQLS